MIFPLRVFGSASVKRMSSGRASDADLLRDVRLQLLLQLVARRDALLERDEAAIASPLSSSGRPTTAASATFGWCTSALSTSIVLEPVAARRSARRPRGP